MTPEGYTRVDFSVGEGPMVKAVTEAVIKALTPFRREGLKIWESADGRRVFWGDIGDNGKFHMYVQEIQQEGGQ